MAEYTMEIRQITEDCKNNLFDFDYNFYLESHKTEFQNKFIDHFYFHEIGFETIARFKHYLKSKLNDIYPYYVQLYQTEVEAKDYNFMLNKDLTETVTNESNMTNEGNNNSIFKESNLSNGNADVNLTTNNLTNINESDDSNSNTSTATNTTTLVSKGNIGTTSTGQLLEAWRQTILNIDMLIIEECQDLFMGVY